MIEDSHVKNGGDRINSSYGYGSFLLQVFCKMPLGHNLVLNVKNCHSHMYVCDMIFDYDRAEKNEVGSKCCSWVNARFLAWLPSFLFLFKYLFSIPWQLELRPCQVWGVGGWENYV